MPAGEHFEVTLRLDDATNRLKITPGAQNTMTLVLDQSTLFTEFLGFRATQGYLQAPEASGTVPGLTMQSELTNLMRTTGSRADSRLAHAGCTIAR